ncbi:MAG: CoA transferase [Dehalococcoidia bacterium]
MTGPLSGLRVLDISEGIAGPFCARLLGDLGADVIKVERPGGDWSRRLGPFPGGVEDAEQSAAFFAFNTSKRGITLDVDTDAGRESLAHLLATHDVVIAGETAGELSARGLGFDQLAAWNQRVILTTISGFGSEGPRAPWKWSHLTTCATGGWARTCGLPDREPLQAGGAITETLTGAFAAVATLLAVYGRRQHGIGDHVDVSAQQAALCAALFPSLRYEYSGALADRNSALGPGPSFILPAVDGYIGVNVLTPSSGARCATSLAVPISPGIRDTLARSASVSRQRSRPPSPRLSASGRSPNSSTRGRRGGCRSASSRALPNCLNCRPTGNGASSSHLTIRWRVRWKSQASRSNRLPRNPYRSVHHCWANITTKF